MGEMCVETPSLRGGYSQRLDLYGDLFARVAVETEGGLRMADEFVGIGDPGQSKCVDGTSLQDPQPPPDAACLT